MSKGFSRRAFLRAGAMASVGAMLANQGFSPRRVRAQGSSEYVYLSIVTQVPFWVDHRAALEDAATLLGVQGTFTGPVDFDVAGQARQLDEIVARNPAGIIIFPGDPNTLAEGVNRAVEAGIPVATVISEIPNAPISVHLGIDGFQAGRIGGRMLAQAIGGRGRVILGTFQSPNVLQRVEGYQAVFAEEFPEIEVAEVVDDRADPAYAPTAYAAAITANPDVVGIGGTDGDSGKGAALAVRDAGRVGEIQIVAMDRNEDMLDFIEDGSIFGSVAQKSYTEMFLAVHLLHWLNTDALRVLPDWRSAGVNILPERVETGVMTITRDNVAQFRHNS
ncbi:MAG: substrate-binding domain-containing protein [Chloroflexi bacterium]|nr:substrate-binding domain-containing protein [Chloroflexota bacterium]